MTPEEARQYLDPKTLVKLQRLDLVARLVVEGFVTGLHRSPYHGFSVEFAEHREYVPGDDIKHIDWKVYGRSDRYYIKQYEEETNLEATIVLDVSESMLYASDEVSKLDYACFVAASLAHMIINQQDSVGMGMFSDEILQFVPPSSHPSHLKNILNSLANKESRKKTDLGRVFETMAERIRKKGLVIIISDLFGDVEATIRGLRHFRHRRHEVVLFHVLDRSELEFPFDSITRFEGLEETGKLLVNPRSLKRAYLEEFNGFIRDIRRACRKSRIDYVMMNTTTPLDVALTSYLATRSERKLA